ncbi:MAG: hypothetical protein J2P53_13760 [Bradyrhizobiaceae bacterium]|nr:hypothetical protein [Bradyrhizobiaceae bacterium]
MRGILCSAVLMALMLPAQAATITVEEFNTGDPAVLVIGHFEAGDENVFRAQTASLTSALVVFVSDGGNADVAFAMGRIIRAKGFATGVTGTYCYSACAIAWLGGVKHYMSLNSQIGFHAVWDIHTRRESGSGNAMLGLYATEMGLSWPAVAWISAKGPTELNMLTRRRPTGSASRWTSTMPEPPQRRPPCSSQWRCRHRTAALLRARTAAFGRNSSRRPER